MNAFLSVLVLETDGKFIRAAVVGRGPRRFSLAGCLKVERLAPGGPVTAGELEMIAPRFANCPKSVVLVSPQVSMVEISMDSKRIKKMKPHQLKEVVRWEAEPYMTIPVTESLVGYQLGRESGDGQSGVWVTMMPGEEFKTMKKTFADAGFRLKRVYPPDVCFPVGAMFAEKEKDMTVIDVGFRTMRVALIEKGGLRTIRILPAGPAAAAASPEGLFSPEQDLSLKGIFDDPAVSGGKVLITGPGAADGGTMRLFSKRAKVSALTPGIHSGCESFAEFATVFGAGLRELFFRGGWKTAGIDDGVDLVRRFKERVHIFPIVVVSVIVLFFLSHYLVLNFQIKRGEGRVNLLRQERDGMKAAADRYAALRKEAEELEKNRRLMTDKMDFMQTGAQKRLQGVGKCLTALLLNAPQDMRFLEIRPMKTKGLWFVSGRSADAMSVSALALKMQGEDWCGYAKILSVSRIEEDAAALRGKSAGENEAKIQAAKEITYKFEMQIMQKD